MMGTIFYRTQFLSKFAFLSFLYLFAIICNVQSAGNTYPLSKTTLSCDIDCGVLNYKALLSYSAKPCLTKREYEEYIFNPVNKLSLYKECKGLRMTAQYYPTAYFFNILNTVGKKQKGKMEKVKEASLQYFSFRISDSNFTRDPLVLSTDNPNQSQQRQYYMEYQAQKDFSLEYNGKVLSCIEYHFTPSMGLTPYCSIEIGFPLGDKLKANEELVLVYNDKIFKIGRLQFAFETNSINRIPKLKI